MSIYEEDATISLDDDRPSPPPVSSSGSDVVGEGIVARFKKRVAGQNWTWTMRILGLIAGGALIAAGLNGFFSLTLNILSYVVAVYLIALGLLLILVIISFPAAWKKLSIKWVPFLHTYRGRAIFMVFLGSLAAGTGQGGLLFFINIILGVFVILVGIAHFLIACFFRNQLSPSTDFNEARSGPKKGELEGELAGFAAQKAWENKETIVNAGWENRDTLAKAGSYIPPQ